MATVNITSAIANSPGSPRPSGRFTSAGGILYLSASGSAYVTSPPCLAYVIIAVEGIAGPGNGQMADLQMQVWANVANSHMALVPLYLQLLLPAGTYSVLVRPGNNTVIDENDVFSVTVIEFPPS